MIVNIKYFKNIKYFLKKERRKDIKYVLMVASKTKFDLTELNDYELDFVGAIFSHIIYNNKLYESGLVVLELNAFMELVFIKNINNVSFPKNEFSQCKSIISIVEGISKYNDSFLERLFSIVDVNTNIIGGGAGFMNNHSDGVLFDTNGFYTDAAILIKIKNNITMGVKHGCNFLCGPYVATSCQENILNKIDYKDAFEVYKNAIYKDCKIELTEDNFEELAKAYPLGIVKYNSEQIVREPIAKVDGKLVLLGEVKNNAILNVLKVDKTSMLEASLQAAKSAISDDSSLVIMFDCISRVQTLQEQFNQELNHVSDLTKRRTTFGAVTVGEIANSGNKYISFYNQTCVVGAVCN